MDEQALLRAIVADPADDTVRLAYADWLDEHDESDRAEFIRVQIELAHLSPEDPRQLSLTAREAELFEVLGMERLRTELPTELIRYGGRYCHDYRRGFLACVSLETSADGVAAFRGAAAVLFAHAPVEELILAGAEGAKDWNTYWSGAQVLTYLDPDAVRELATVPELSRLGVLTLCGPASNMDAVCRAIVANPHLRQLRRLWIQNRYPSFETLNGLNGGQTEFLVDPISPSTQAELRAAFGDRVTWDA